MIESAERFVSLRESSDPAEYRRAAQEEAEVQVWNDVIDRYPEMRQWVAYNKTVPIDILRRLARDENREVRCAVADKRKLTADMFKVLASDGDSAVRSRVAYNRKAPDAILEQLAEDPEPLVREAAAGALRRRHG